MNDESILLLQRGNTDRVAGKDEEFITLVYRYYELRGIKNIVTVKISNLVTTLFLLFVIIFMATFIDYSVLFKSYKFEDAINWSNPINPVLIVYMVFFLGYWLWKLVKTIHDIRKLWIIHKFYRDNLGIDTFSMQNTSWGQISSKILNENRFRGRYDSAELTQLIMRQENYILGILRHLLKYHNNISVSKILEWELGFIVFMSLFEQNKTKLKSNIDTDTFRKQLKIIGILNIFLVPFLLILSGVYIVFRYGEMIYTKPQYLTLHEWSKWAQCMKLKDYSELPHEYEHRVYLAKKYADKYIGFFRPGLLYNLAQLLMILFSIIFAVFCILTIVNFNFLLKFELWGKSCSQYVSSVFTIILILKRYLNQYTRELGSQEKANKYLSQTMELLRCTHHVDWNYGEYHTKMVYSEFSNRWYLGRFRVVLIEIWGILTLPYLFLRTIPNFTEPIIEFLHQNTQSNELVGDILVPELLMVTTI